MARRLSRSSRSTLKLGFIAFLVLFPLLFLAFGKGGTDRVLLDLPRWRRERSSSPSAMVLEETMAETGLNWPSECILTSMG